MSKKEYIMMVLTALENDRPLAKDLKRFLLLDKFDAQAIDGLLEFFQQGFVSVKSLRGKEKLEKSVVILQKIKQMENDQQLEDESSCNELEAMIQSL